MTTVPARRRLEPGVFNLPVDKMRAGYYSDAYFNRVKEILIRDGRRPRVLMQVFNKKDAVLCGIDEAIAIVKLCSGRQLPNGGWEPGWADLDMRALHDGDRIAPYETVMTIEGDYTAFAHLETDYLGVLARRTKVATNTSAVVAAASGKNVLFFPARFDHHLVQTGDGYAAYISGALGVSTDAQAEWWGSRGFGTVPHSLIAAYGGDTILAVQKFAEHVDPNVNVIALVDFDNDCVNTDVKIIVSGGFTVEKIRAFENAAIPVDAYAVGSALFEGKFDFTADIALVEIEGAMRECHKAGRPYQPNTRLEKVV